VARSKAVQARRKRRRAAREDPIPSRVRVEEREGERIA